MKTVATTTIMRKPEDGRDGSSVITAVMESQPSFTWMIWQGLAGGMTYAWYGVKNAADYKVGDTIVVAGYVTDKEKQVNCYGTVTDVSEADDGIVTAKVYNLIGSGENGESALYITATPETDSFPADNGGIATQNTTHTVELRLYYGDKALEDYDVEVCSADDAHWYTAETVKKMGGDVYVSSIEKHGAVCTVWYEVGEASYADDNAYIQVRLTSAEHGARVKQVNCYARRKGETGERGAVLRGPQAWEDCAVGYSFQAGGDGEEYKDIVTYKGYYYSCMTAHQKTAGNAPLSTADTNGGLWKLADSVEMVATKILLSEYALVKNLGVETVEMKDAAGNVVFMVKDGAVTCKTGTFENVEISGTLTEGTVQIDGSSLYNWLTPGKSVYAVGTDGMKSVTINNPCGNLVCLPTYNGFTDKVYEWDGNFEGAELEREFLRVPSFTKGGTHLTLQTGTVKGTEGWAALPESNWETLSHYFGNMMEHCVLICADPQTLVRAEGGTSVVMPSHVWNGQSPNTGAASNGYYGYGHGRFSYKGAIGRFVVLLPGQHLHLISAVETVRNSKGVDEQCLVWHIENAADFAPVAMRMYVNDSAGVYYEDFPSGTTNLDMVDGGVDYWQDMLFAPPILDVKRNGAGYDSGIVQLTVLLGGVDTKYPLPRLVFY